MPVDYRKGKIYKIESLEGDCVYYGSTCELLSRRMAKHRDNYKNNRGVTSEQILCFDDAKIYLVENYPCNTKEELHAREAYYIKNNDCVNKCIPNRTHKEWYQDNKEEHLKKNKEWYLENRDEQLKKKKEWYLNHKEEQKILSREWRLKHKEKIAQYRIKHKEMTNRREICECGTFIQTYNKKSHLKTQLHKTLLSNPFINFKL